MRRDALKTVAELRAEVSNSDVVAWPTCLHCVELTKLRTYGMTWIPVEGYRVEPDVFRPLPVIHADGKHGAHVVADVLNPPRQNGTRGWFTVIAQCHGVEAKAEIDVPIWWQTHHVRAAIQSLMFFGTDKGAEHRENTNLFHQGNRS